MQRRLVTYRRRLLIRVGVLLIATISVAEFVDSSVLRSFGVSSDSFLFHFIKVFATVIVALPIFSLWIRDYVVLRNAELHRREERDDFAALFVNNPDMISFHGLDGQIIDANPSFLRHIELPIHKIREFGPFATEDPQRIAEIQSYFEKAAQGEVQQFLTEQKLHNGNVIVLDMTLFPIYRHRRPIAIYAIARNVTKEKSTEKKLMESQAINEAFIYYTSDAISIVDTSGNVLLVNPAWEELYGWTEKEVLSRPIPFPDEALIQSIVTTRTAIRTELSLFSKSGRQIWVSLSGAPILSSEGAFLGVSFISKDMTRRIKTEEWMRRSEKLTVVGELAAGLAHEIRNPLAAIRGFLQLLHEEPNVRYLEFLMVEVDRIDQMTNELLMLAKPQSSVFEHVDVGRIIHDVLVLMQSQAHLHGILVTERLPDNLPTVYGVSNQLKQVFINVIKNAMEAQPNGGFVAISNETKGDYLTIVISDAGPGMSNETLSRLGEPFYTTKGRGTGLGLMVTYRIVQFHHGEISVHSELGHGTRFSVSLPISNPDVD